MYTVIELQTNSEGTTSIISTTHSTQAEAESKYHDILHYAAISNVAIHSAAILTPESAVIRNQCYKHLANKEETNEQ